MKAFCFRSQLNLDETKHDLQTDHFEVDTYPVWLSCSHSRSHTQWNDFRQKFEAALLAMQSLRFFVDIYDSLKAF